MSIADLIASVGDRLTPTERRVAKTVLEDPTSLAFGSVSDLADRAGTSRPSIVRFATKLGFEGFSDLQAWAREGVSRQLSSPSERIRRTGEPVSRLRTDLERSLQTAFEALSPERLAGFTPHIVEARNIWILSGETSMAGAHALHSGLSMVRPDVHLVSEQAAARELSNAIERDVALVIDFARYRRHSISAARTLADLGVTLIAITDGPLSPLATLTPHWCALRLPAVGPFDSSVPAVAAAELIVAAVVARLGDAARDRIDRLETLWQATGTFLDYQTREARDADQTRQNGSHG